MNRANTSDRRAWIRFAALLPLVMTACAPADGGATGFAVEVLAEGVMLFRPAEGERSRTNSLVVERADGLLVVESQPTPEAARALLAAIAERSSKPVRYLVLSHPHAESAGGASAFPETTLIVASEELRDALKDPQRDFGAEMRLMTTPAERFTEPPRRAPTLLLTGRTTFDDPVNPVDIVLMPPCHAPGNVIVILQREELVYAGALLFPDGNPYAKDGNVGHWINMLNHLARSKYRALVPLRGPAIDAEALRRNRDALAWLRGQVETAFVDLEPVAEIPGQVLAIPGIRDHLALDTDPSFATLLIEQIVNESVIERKKRGRPIP